MSRHQHGGQYDGGIPPYTAHRPAPRPSAPPPSRRPPTPGASNRSTGTQAQMRREPQHYYANPAAAEASVEELYGPSAYDYGYDQEHQWSQLYAPPDRPYHPPGQHSFSAPGPGPANSYTSRVPHYPQSQLPRPVYQTNPYADQVIPQQATFGFANRRPPLGPPPSARRGPASYYPPTASVHPIVEESDSQRGSSHRSGRNSKNSYASSNAIPIGVPSYYLNDDGRRSPAPSMPGFSSDESQYSPVDVHPLSFDDRTRPEPEQDPSSLVRQASLGRKSKPVLTTVKSSDRLKKHAVEAVPALPSERQDAAAGPAPREHDAVAGAPDSSDHATTDAVAAAVPRGGAAALAAALAQSQRGEAQDDGSASNLKIPRPFDGGQDLSSSDSELEAERRSKRKHQRKKARESERGQTRDLGRSPLSKEVQVPGSPEAPPPQHPLDSPIVAEILKGLEKGGAWTPTEEKAPESASTLKTPTRGFSQRDGKRRPPPRLNVDAVRDAEVRGSLTSLTDLIKRATRLASNLDRGRTASRLGMSWFDGAEEHEKARDPDALRRSGISDILASFPPPNAATPPGSRGEWRRWSSRMHQHSELASESDAGPETTRKRRCCGLPLWLFLLLLIVAILVIAAAIIVPVVLLVVPRQASHQTSSAVAGCKAELACENGGTNVLGSDGDCRCLCVNGYTGTTCTTPSTEDCTTTTIGATSDASVGSAIPALLAGAESNFSIPLDGTTIYQLFTSLNTSCRVENSLVTFNSQVSKRKRGLFDLAFDAVAPTVHARDGETSTATTATTSSDSAAATTDGIVYETGSPTATTTSSSTTATSTSAAASSSASSASNSTTLAFAGVTVLYVFQASGELDAASNAQTYLNAYFANTAENMNPQNVSLGNGFTCDLDTYQIGLSNGSLIGGGSGS